jgi:hypothetical protein
MSYIDAWNEANDRKSKQLSELSAAYDRYERQIRQQRLFLASNERIRANWVKSDMDETWTEINRLRAELGFEE